jgi:hypothetical protein
MVFLYISWVVVFSFYSSLSFHTQHNPINFHIYLKKSYSWASPTTLQNNTQTNIKSISATLSKWEQSYLASVFPFTFASSPPEAFPLLPHTTQSRPAAQLPFLKFQTNSSPTDPFPLPNHRRLPHGNRQRHRFGPPSHRRSYRCILRYHYIMLDLRPWWWSEKKRRYESCIEKPLPRGGGLERDAGERDMRL